MLTMTGAPNGSTVELNWLPPFSPNGIIRYEIEYKPAKTPGNQRKIESSGSTYFTLTLPSEFLSYNVKVAAVNTKGRRKSNVLVVVCSGAERGIYCK